MKATKTARVVVESGSHQVEDHAGLHALGSLAYRRGLGAVNSDAISHASEHRALHDRGEGVVYLITGPAARSAQATRPRSGARSPSRRASIRSTASYKRLAR